MQLLRQTHPRAPRGPRKVRENPWDHSWKFAYTHKSKVVGDLKIGCFGFMQLYSQTQPWSPRALVKSGKPLGSQVR